MLKKNSYKYITNKLNLKIKWEKINKLLPNYNKKSKIKIFKKLIKILSKIDSKLFKKSKIMDQV